MGCQSIYYLGTWTLRGRSRKARGHSDDPWDDNEWINSDIPEASRPATPPPSRPASSEVAHHRRLTDSASWLADTTNNKGPTAWAEIRRDSPTAELPQFDFVTHRRFDGYPVLSTGLPPLNYASWGQQCGHAPAWLHFRPTLHGRSPTTAFCTSIRC